MPETSIADCVFCRIINRKAEASVIHEDDHVLAFLDIGPVNPGHSLIVPKQHFQSLADLPEAIGAHCFTVAQRIAMAIRKSGLPCEGINMFLAEGEAAFQEVPHFHLHVFPRFKGDTFKLSADWSAKPTREELDATARQLRTTYNAER